ncbi:MAG: four helix bundle protein [Cyclobacteriaceae bacterium]|nr:four helix bundle protein [Cyclobacteriaceae bacterium]
MVKVMRIEKFEEIESWKLARELTKEIYRVTKLNNFSKDFGLKDQIQRASVSIMANISEGFDSGSDKSFINFLNYSYRSASEVQSLLYVVLDQKYISKNEFDFLYEKCKDIKNLIGGLIQYLKKKKD